MEEKEFLKKEINKCLENINICYENEYDEEEVRLVRIKFLSEFGN